MLVASGLGAVFIMVAASASLAGTVDVTPELRQKATAACSSDALRLCAQAIGDEAQIVACMKGQRAQLTPSCRQVYDQVAKVLKNNGLSAAKSSP